MNNKYTGYYDEEDGTYILGIDDCDDEYIAHDKTTSFAEVDMIGKIINDTYKIEELLGKAEVTRTYLVTTLKQDKKYTMKYSSKTNTNSDFNYEFVKNAIMNETNMIKSLNHPQITRIVDIVDKEDYFYVISDYIEGETLDSLLSQNKRMSVEFTVDCAKQVCNVLSYLHNLNPAHIHRDIKPSNLILNTNGIIILEEFGIMRLYDPTKTCDTVSLGTAGYASPEQYGSRQTDARSDIYSLGMTMYHLVTGINPSDHHFVYRPICEVNHELPKGLEYIIQKCTEMDPDKRYQSCGELVDDLIEYQNLPKKGLFAKIFNK